MDMIRNITGSMSVTVSAGVWPNNVAGAFYLAKPGGLGAVGSASTSNTAFYFDPSRVVPVGAANKPRGWGALACAYLGTPAL
jgi:hypothetical protein